MSGDHRTVRPAPLAAGARVLVDAPLRLVLLAAVMVLGSLLFALALLPPLAAAGRSVERFSFEFNKIGSDVDLQFPRMPERSTIYAADGSVLATLFLDENRKIVRLKQVNDLAKNAVLAIEDDEFYEHPGLDVEGIVRALVTNVRAGDIRQGASTITQQLARNVFTSIGTEDTLARKLHEARVAMRLEEVYSKEEILQVYLNEVYFGRGVYGLGTAAEYYFGTSVRKLTLPQAAMLAGLIAAPEAYSPVNNERAAVARRNLVIDRMAALGMVPRPHAEAAKREPLGLNITQVGNEQAKFPFFVEYLKEQILRDARFGRTKRARIKTLFQGGLKIYTTLEPDLQRAGERIVRQHLPRPSDPESAVAAVDVRTGAVKAVVGGTDFTESQVNLATGQGGSGRQAGSAFKPFTLVAAMEEGIPIGKVYLGSSGQDVNCAPYGPRRYRVVNAGDGGGSGYIDMATATENSVNAYFVHLAIDVGPPKIADAANRMGIQSELDPYCTITLGVEEVTPLEMASSFATLANGGVHCTPFAITRVVTRNKKEILAQKRGRCEQVVEQKVADKVAGLLRLVVEGGTGTAADLGRWPVFGKTGTTNDSADVWFSGCTRQVCSATWVGHRQGRVPMPGAYGGTVAAPIWHDFMLEAMRGLPARPLPPVPKPERLPVPDVVGKRQAEAIDILAEAHFTPVAEQVPSTQPAGTVVAQSPPGGTRVTGGSSVTIRVSNGKPPVTRVPNVRGLAADHAVAALNASGYRVDVTEQPTSRRKLDGLVAAQAPSPGTRLPKGSVVGISVYRYEKPSKGKSG